MEELERPEELGPPHLQHTDQTTKVYQGAVQ